MSWRHDGVIKRKHFLYYWPFVRGMHLSLVNSPHKGQWRRALMFSLICTWINGWVNNREAGDLRCHHTHYDITVMEIWLHDKSAIDGCHATCPTGIEILFPEYSGKIFRRIHISYKGTFLLLVAKMKIWYNWENVNKVGVCTGIYHFNSLALGNCGSIFESIIFKFIITE